MRILVLWQVLAMAWESLRSHKMRSALTVLGIVIGIMMVVGMTSLIRGFDKSITGQIESIGSDTIYLTKFSALSLTGGAGFRELISRPDITDQDAETIAADAVTVQNVSVMYGSGFPPAMAMLAYQGRRTEQSAVIGASPRFIGASDRLAIHALSATECREPTRRRAVG